MENSIVWGTCWFNESVDTLVNFLNSSLDSLKKKKLKVVPIVFVAKFEHDENEINHLKNEINDVIILKNCTNIFPNKNYGVAIIAKKAYELGVEYVAIVDCDWDIKENISFVNGTVLNLINNDYDIVIPNIANASGRSNLLIGRTIINLFYPDYKNVLLTPFPGSLISKTKMLYKIVMDDGYHYDWGGEWDIISLAIKYNMKISSALVDVKNVRHRPNNSKIQDSFQIWRAVLGNNQIIDRFNNLIHYNIDINTSNELTKKLLSKKHTVLEMINIIIESNSTKTQKQILYMILYPLAFLTGEIDSVPMIESDGNTPYDKEELNQILDLAMYCAKSSLIDCNIKNACKRCKSITGEYLSNWTIDNQKKAMKEFMEV